MFCGHHFAKVPLTQRSRPTDGEADEQQFAFSVTFVGRISFASVHSNGTRNLSFGRSEGLLKTGSSQWSKIWPVVSENMFARCVRAGPKGGQKDEQKYLRSWANILAGEHKYFAISQQKTLVWAKMFCGQWATKLEVSKNVLRSVSKTLGVTKNMWAKTCGLSKKVLRGWAT